MEKANEILAIFQSNNCSRCRFGDPEKVGTGEPCCTRPILPVAKGGVCLSRKDKPVKKYTLTLTQEEAQLLANRLVPISPADYSLHDYALLRGLYGRLEYITLKG